MALFCEKFEYLCDYRKLGTRHARVFAPEFVSNENKKYLRTNLNKEPVLIPTFDVIYKEEISA